MAAAPPRLRARYTAIFREGAWVVVGQGAAIVAALLGLAQLTRFLEPDEYGRVALALSIGNLFNLVGFGAMAGGAARFVSAARDTGEHHHLFAAMIGLAVRRGRWLIATGVVVAVVVAATISPAMGVFVLLTLLYSLAFSLATGGEVVLNAARLRGVVAFHKLLQQALNYGFAILLLITVETSARMVLLGFALGAGLTAISEWRVLTRRLLTEPSAAGSLELRDVWAQRIRDYARPSERWAIPYWLQASADRWILAAFRGTDDAGLYAVVYQLGYTPLGLFSSLLAQTMDPVVFARAGAADSAERLARADRLRHLGTLGYGAVVAMAVAGGFLFHELVFRIFVDTAYASASRWLPWMACAAGLFGLAQMQALKWMARLQPQRLQTSRIATSAVSIALVAAGAYIGGASGVVAAQVLSALIFLAWTFAIR